jgi:hypothetical protein
VLDPTCREANFMAGYDRSLDGGHRHELPRMRELTREEAGLVTGGGVIIGAHYVHNYAKAVGPNSVTSTFSDNAVINGLGGANGANG